MSDQLGVNSDGSFDPQFRHPDGRRKSYYERQDFRTRQGDAARHVQSVVQSAADKVKAREPNIYRRQISDMKKAGPGYLPGDRQRHQRRLEQLESAAITEDEKLAEVDRLEAIKADPFIQKQLAAVEGLRTHAVGDDELQAVERARALAEEGLLGDSEKEIQSVMEGVVERLDASLKDSRNREHLATEAAKANLARITEIREGLGVTEGTTEGRAN